MSNKKPDYGEIWPDQHAPHDTEYAEISAHPFNKDYLMYIHHDHWGNEIHAIDVVWYSDNYMLKVAHDVTCHIWLENAKWQARISSLNLGAFATVQDAKQAVLRKLLELQINAHYYPWGKPKEASND